MLTVEHMLTQSLFLSLHLFGERLLQTLKVTRGVVSGGENCLLDQFPSRRAERAAQLVEPPCVHAELLGTASLTIPEGKVDTITAEECNPVQEWKV
ncbi:hypothetical protein AALO_G00296490 [Alosa alosa]|uniref:Uncharacterized protein n=1 Tax=Alosa alosa TaxID=278164 RepID=A0AAV6FGI1_9TELE|nr:hypothetical protein AALO_G00296490 [Alosa alosa]